MREIHYTLGFRHCDGTTQSEASGFPLQLTWGYLWYGDATMNFQASAHTVRVLPPLRKAIFCQPYPGSRPIRLSRRHEKCQMYFICHVTHGHRPGQVNWGAIGSEAGTMVWLSLFLLLLVPIRVPTLAVATGEDVDFDKVSSLLLRRQIEPNTRESTHRIATPCHTSLRANSPSHHFEPSHRPWTLGGREGVSAVNMKHSRKRMITHFDIDLS